MKKRFIEENFPVQEVSIEGANEKNIRHGNVSTLHTWWSRKPLSVSRSVLFSTLIDYHSDSKKNNDLRNSIIDISKYASYNDSHLLNIIKSHLPKNSKDIKVLDPFGGGGSIPLESLRLGCETYSMDYNPVAYLIQKCLLDFPFYNTSDIGKLPYDVKKWSSILYDKVNAKLISFFPQEKDKSFQVGYYWFRTIPCPNPSCGITIPLTANWWLAVKKNKKIALKPVKKNNELSFKLLTEFNNTDFDPDNGTVNHAKVVCPFCNSVIDSVTLRKLFIDKKNSEILSAVVTFKKGQKGKSYRVANSQDLESYEKAKEYLFKQIPLIENEWGVPPIPDEELKRVPIKFGVINVWVYGFITWGSLFNYRQLLSNIIFIDELRKLYPQILKQEKDDEYSKIIMTYLSFAIDKLIDSCSSFCRWKSDTEQVIPALSGRQAIPMMWDYFELNPFCGISRSWHETLDVLLDSFRILKNIKRKATVIQGSATSLPFKNDTFDIVFTDPPYYDLIPYSYLSDFYYVWLKRCLYDIFPEVFSTPLSPKNNEVVAYTQNDNETDSGYTFFEENLTKSFKEINRVLKQDAIAVIVYAHKSTSGWEKTINSLLDSGLVITASWPINTEMETRMRANDSATLSSSIYIVARKMKRQPTGFYNEVKEELKQYLSEKLDHLWAEGITGADFFIAAIGSGIEVFGKYEKVMDYEGNVKRADVLLDDVREIVMQYTVKQILHNGFSGEISELAKFYVVWRFSFGEAKAEFDEANKLARSVGIDLSQEWAHKGFIKKEKEFIRVLGPHQRKLDDIEGSFELIDVLHGTLLLYEKGNKDDMMQLLAISGYGKSEAFFRVAQAISESLGKLTPDSKEKKLLDSFLGGKERIKSEVVTTKIKKDQQMNLEF